jgi:predicted anti-sigma-YlaC factor YlaD
MVGGARRGNGDRRYSPGRGGRAERVLSVFTVVLAVYVISESLSGAVSLDRILSHLPVLLGTVLAMSVWRDARSPGPQPRSDALPVTDDGALRDNASRGRRRGHLASRRT